MNHIIMITVVVAACLAASSSSPTDQPRRLVAWPAPALEPRVRRSEQYAKGRPGAKTRPPPPASLRKGEYLCGGKVCKLRPGDKPPCELCQYPVLL